MYTKGFFEILSSFLTFFVFGLLLSNSILLYISLVPLFFVLLGIVMDIPKKVILKRKELKMESFTGDVIEISVDVLIKDGVGMIVVGDKLPPHFELVGGNNFKVIWKGLQEKKENVRYKVRCTKRGVYNIDNLIWESNHVFNFREPFFKRCDQKLSLFVRPRTLDIRRIRNLKSISNLPMPLGAMHRTGISTTDFKEIRKYGFGDTFRSINWKVTARMATRPLCVPYVNEYEKEGKKIVWLFVDGSEAMVQLGTTISNPFEYALIAVNDLANYYLKRNCLVGVYLVSSKSRFIFPDIGRSQKYKISRELLTMKIADEEPLREAVEKCQKYMVGSNPLCIILTTLAGKEEEEKISNVIGGIKEIAKHSKRHIRGSPPILLVNILGYYFVADSIEKRLAADILKVEEIPAKRRIRKSGAVVVDWDPTKEKLLNVLLKEVKAH